MPKDSKSVLALPKLKAQNQRNPFDLSFKTVFHIPFGMLLPCGFWRVDEGDYFEINNELQIINDTIIRPAFMRLKTHVDYFFVPYSQLWKPFDNLVTGQNNFDSQAVAYYQSNNGSPRVPNSVPMFDGSALAEALHALSTSFDEHGYKEHLGALRLLDLLGYGEYYAARDVMDEDNPENAWPQDMKPSSILPQNFFNLLAYQKIYYDFYRNRRYEDCETSAFNIDDFSAGTIIDDGHGEADIERLARMLRVHYRWLKKDYFTQVQPSVLPDANTIGFEGIQTSYGQQTYIESGTLSPTYSVPGAAYPGAYLSELTSNPTNYSGDFVHVPNSQSVANIRLAFAYDKLLRRMRNASGSFSAQMLAQFGVTPKDYRGGEVRFIGGFTNRVMPSDITQTVNTQNAGSNLGEIGGQINQYAQQQKPLKFRVEEKGIVMAIVSTSLENDYQSFRIARANLCRQRFDWFNPAFENLGLAPLYRAELTYVENQRLGSQSAGDQSIATKDNQLKILGFIPRYADQKTHFDEVHGLFNQFHDLAMKDWTTQFVFDQEIDGQSTPVEPLSIHYLTASPAQFDTVVQTKYNGEWNTDPFKVNMYHSFRCMSNKSVNGETF